MKKLSVEFCKKIFKRSNSSKKGRIKLVKFLAEHQFKSSLDEDGSVALWVDSNGNDILYFRKDGTPAYNKIGFTVDDTVEQVINKLEFMYKNGAFRYQK